MPDVDRLHTKLQDWRGKNLQTETQTILQVRHLTTAGRLTLRVRVNRRKLKSHRNLTVKSPLNNAPTAAGSDTMLVWIGSVLTVEVIDG